MSVEAAPARVVAVAVEGTSALASVLEPVRMRSQALSPEVGVVHIRTEAEDRLMDLKRFVLYC